jgi:hypothetical protein
VATRDEIIHLLDDLRTRQFDEMRPHLANMDSRGEISSKGNYHSGVAKGLEIALNLVRTIDAGKEP